MTLDDLKVGDIFAVIGSGFLAEEVQKITHSPIAHVAMYTGSGMCFEENGFYAVGGVPAERYLTAKGTMILRVKGITEDQVKGVMQYLTDHYHEAYDYTEILDLLIKYKLGITIEHHDPNKAICSTILARALKENGIDAFSGMDTDSIIPGDYPKSTAFDTIAVI